jgi:hypothetical protein
MTLHDPAVAAELDSVAARTRYGLADVNDKVKAIAATYAQRAAQIQDEQAKRMEQIVEEAAKARAQPGKESAGKAGWTGSRPEQDSVLDFTIDEEPAPEPAPPPRHSTAPRPRTQRSRRPEHADDDEDFSGQTWLR